MNRRRLLQTILKKNILADTYQASLAPPGMSEGPYLAPSSPPLTPLPTKKMPFSWSSLQRLWNKAQSSLTFLLMPEPYKQQLAIQTQN